MKKVALLFAGLLIATPAFAIDPATAGFFLASFTGFTVSYATAAFAAFAFNYAVSTLVTRAFTKKPPKIQDNGVRQQIPPSSTNSIPVVYGDAYLGGTFIDAALTVDQKVMYYVMVISHISPNGQFTFDKTKMYYGDRLITFSSSDGAAVESLTDGAGQVDTKIFGKLKITLFTSDAAGNITNHSGTGVMPWSSGDSVMGPDSGIDPALRWPSTGRRMNGTAFAIARLVYDQEKETTNLQQITYKCSHYLNSAGCANPGDVWYDYITNPIYGGDINTSLVDSNSATNLVNYSNQTITFTDNQGNPSTQPRYRINGVLDTGETVLENIDKVLMACDSWMAYDAPSGKWSIVINKAESTAFFFNDTNIVGDIRVGTTDINQAINQIEARFPSKLNKDIPDYVYLETPAGLLYPNEPANKYTMSLDLVNDSVQAQYLCNRMLEQAREDLIVSIKTTYAGIQINAGDVVSVTNSAFGWTNKLFRTMRVNEVALPDGTLGASLELNEYNAQVYDDKPITEFAAAGNSDIPSANFFANLAAPTISDQLPTAAIPSFAVNCIMPSVGRVTLVYLYYTTVSSPTTTDWQLLGTQALTDGRVFSNSSTVKFSSVILPANTYYFAFKVANEVSQSSLSPLSGSYAWSPNPTSTVTGSAFVAQFSPPNLQVPYANSTPTFTGITPQLYGTVAGGAIDYVNAGTDSDTLFVNNSWRIGASSTTGLGDIVSTNITIASPTDGGNYAIFPQPTAMSGSPATISVPVRYKDSGGNVYQSANAVCQLVFSVKGDTGTPGNKTATVYLYQWATTQPSNPSGTSTYTWATGANTSYTGGNGWSVSVPANPGTPSIKLWTATKSISALGSDVSTSVDWTTGVSVQAVSQNGANGIDGVQSATPTVYQWSITIPAGPTGSSTYTWSTNTFTPTPAGWTLTGGTAPSAGYTLYAARVNLVDSASVSTSTINWTTATIAAVGYAGTNGTNGTNGTAGASARICYTKTTLSSLASSPSTITTSGSTSYPPNGSWGAGTVWQATPPAIVAGESVYQSDGIYDPSTNQTVWNVPYLSALKVGTLSAITVNTGTLSVTGALTVGTTGNVNGGQSDYNSGTGFFLGYSGGAYKFSIGSSSTNMLWTGSGLQVNGATITGGSISIGSGNTPYGTAFSILTSGLTFADNIFGGIFRGDNTYYNGAAITGYASNGYTGDPNYGIYGVAVVGNTSPTAHGVRGSNIYWGTSGLVGPANGFDFYANGAGTNYGPFTGTHDSLVPKDQTFIVGDIVIDTQIVIRNGVSSTLSLVATSNQSNQAGALGVVCANPRPLSSALPAAYIDGLDPANGDPIVNPQYAPDCAIYNVMAVNAVGEGQINVCGEGGDIATGDLIVTSSTPGKGMKQSDDIVRSITVAKARENVTFSSPTEVKMIACIYLSG